MWFYSYVLLFHVIVIDKCLSVKFYNEKATHQPRAFSDEQIHMLANHSDMIHFESMLKNILVPRVVGTPEHEGVARCISQQMTSLGWDVKEDSFYDQTPLFGKLKFTNIISTLNPNADRYLVMACHYDSKYVREHNFVGATDSAVPCAMLVNLAKVLSRQLQPMKNSNLSLMFIFFDGEEAFRQWGPTDSIYGARHLANKWKNTPYKGVNNLSRMDMLFLLDLLGTPDPTFYSYFKATERWYVRLADAEERLSKLNKFNGYTVGSEEQKYFRLRSSGAQIEDDHVPFMRNNVNILHMIPTPFPDVWHQANDDYSALDFNTIENLNKILRVFVAEYLHLNP